MSLAIDEAGGVSAWRHLRAIVLLPLMNAVLIPGAIVVTTGGTAHAPASGLGVSVAARLAVGIGMLGVGICLVAGAAALFVRRGEGTLAPWDPPCVLVVAGAYRHCRNPMKVGLLVTLLGEAALLDSAPLLVWFVAFAAANVIYIRLSEEPALARRFGRRYAEYCRHVPRWIPRRSAWVSDESQENGER